jgi:hypothetical protein
MALERAFFGISALLGRRRLGGDGLSQPANAKDRINYARQFPQHLDSGGA